MVRSPLCPANPLLQTLDNDQQVTSSTAGSCRRVRRRFGHEAKQTSETGNRRQYPDQAFLPNFVSFFQ